MHLTIILKVVLKIFLLYNFKLNIKRFYMPSTNNYKSTFLDIRWFLI